MNEQDLARLGAALGRVPSGLYILTARNQQRETGLLASWVQQCAFQPPQLSVCVRRGRYILEWLEEGVALTLNVLAEEQTSFVSHFGKGFDPHEDAFVGLNVERVEGEAPILVDALAHLCCRVANRVSTGDHELLIATVVSGRLHKEGGEPMVHLRKNGLRY